jgi:hypothetical protein
VKISNRFAALENLSESLDINSALEGEGRGVYRVLVGRRKRRRQRGRTRRRWEDNIKMDLGALGINGANWILLGEDRFQWRAFVNTVMNLQVP